MDRYAAIAVRHEGQYLGIAGIRIKRILSAELFKEKAGLSQSVIFQGPAESCQDCWTDLAAAIAMAPKPMEMLVVWGNSFHNAHGGRDVGVLLLALTRAKSAAAARSSAVRSARDLLNLITSILDYAEFEKIEDQAVLDNAMRHLRSQSVVELRRRTENISVSQGTIQRKIVGFGSCRSPKSRPRVKERAEISLLHLFPWVPSDDTWRRLLEALAQEQNPAAFVVHLRGWSQAPADCLDEARAAVARAEKIAAFDFDKEVETILSYQAEMLRIDAHQRLLILEGRVLAARVFLTSDASPSAAFIITAEGSIDDASVRPGQLGSESIFRGGVQRVSSSEGEILAPLDRPSADVLFGPREMTAILRTPLPVDSDLPGIEVNRARTASLTGRSGNDVRLGLNVHRSSQQPVALEGSMRFRHTYVLGQTGTGKSNLLLHMILHDISKGRGVAVLDPHGTLIEEILLHFPKERADDVVLMDVTDTERPVGFNILRIRETDSFQYRLTRDLVIDDIYAFLDRIYDFKAVGGPIFETHFRGMLGLLLGTDPQTHPYIPNLMILRQLYTNGLLRAVLHDKVRGKDFVLDEFIQEATRVGGEGSLANVAPYVTAKFNRFVSDIALRNITCQNEMLDMEEIISKGKVLLLYLGKGRFGEHASGLLASNVISQIRNIMMKRGLSKGHPPFYLYADELHTFADERFSELLAEARKFNLSLTVAHQYMKQIPEAILQGILGNVGTMVVFRVGAYDAELLEPLFKPTFSARDLASLPNFRAYIRSFGILGQTPFSVEVPAPPEGGDLELAGLMREKSRNKYGRARADVEEEIEATHKAFEELGETKLEDTNRSI